MEPKPAVAVVFHHIGPYHHARLNAAADRLSVTGIEWSAKGYDAWGAAATPARYHKVSLFPEATDFSPGDAELRCAFIAFQRRVRPAGKIYLSGRRVRVNGHRAGGGRNRPHPVTRHRNTGCCSERVAHFLCGLHDPPWLCRAHYVLARISSKCRCAECQREHDTCASNRRTAKATKPVSYCHAVIVIPFRILRKLS
jgi:hypothetical protein